MTNDKDSAVKDVIDRWYDSEVRQPTQSDALQVAALKAMERLAHIKMELSLAEWSEISGTILAALRQPTQSDALREAALYYMSQFGQALEANGIPYGPAQIEADRNLREALVKIELDR